MRHDDWGTRDRRWAGIRSDDVSVVGHPVRVLRADPASVGAPEPDPAAAPILLVHGLGGSSTNWLEVLGGLAATAPTVAVDLPGFGETRPPHPRAARMRPQVHFLGHLLDALGWEHAELHGNSMGGLLSVLFAGEQTARVRRLALASPALPTPVHRVISGLNGDLLRTFAPFALSRRAGLAAIHARYADATPEELFGVREALVMGDAATMRPALRQVGVEHAVNALARPWRAEGLSHASSDLVAQLTVRRREVERAIDAITCDVLVVWGEQDRLVSGAAMDAVVARRPEFVRRDLPGVGHTAMIEQPDAYLDLVAAWRPSPVRAGGGDAA